jgi:hypothetical protein
MCASSQIQFAVLPSCFTTPFTFVTMWKCGGFGANSFGTMNGPNGAHLSVLLPANQFGPPNMPVSGRRPRPPRSLRSYMTL